MNPLLFLGGGEIVIILLIVVMFFGSKRIPEIARGLGKGMKEIRNVSDELKREIQSSGSGLDKAGSQIKRVVDDAGSGFKSVGDQIKKSVETEFLQDEMSQPRKPKPRNTPKVESTDPKETPEQTKEEKKEEDSSQTDSTEKPNKGNS